MMKTNIPTIAPSPNIRVRKRIVLVRLRCLVFGADSGKKEPPPREIKASLT